MSRTEKRVRGAAAWSLWVLVGVALLDASAGDKNQQGPSMDSSSLTDEQRDYYEGVFAQYDMDHDGFITMEENIEQDRAIAEEQGKPFDEVCHPSFFPSLP